MQSSVARFFRWTIIPVAVLVLRGTIIGQIAPPIVWQETYGGSHDEMGRNLLRTADNGFVVSGFTTSVDGDISGQNGDHDMWVFKIDSTGTLLWQQTLGGVSWDDAHGLAPAADGGYFLTGYITPYPVLYSDIGVVKLDSGGNVQWNIDLGGSSNETVACIEGTPDGGCILIARTTSNDGDVSGNHGADDAWVVKLDSAGGLEWQRCYGGSLAEVGWSITRTMDGGYVFTASSLSSDGDVSQNLGANDVWVVKVDSVGAILWEQSFGGTWSENPFDLALTSDGGYVIAARTSSNDGDVSGLHGDEDAWIVKLDSLGNLQWQHCIGGSLFDTPIDMDQLYDGGFIFTGNTRSADGDVTSNQGWSDAWVVRLDPFGDLLWQKTMGGTDFDGGSAIVALPNGHFMMAGHAQSNDGDVQDFIGVRDVWLVELGEEDFSTAVDPSLPAPGLSATPNPSNGVFRITGDIGSNAGYVIFNSLGAAVFSGHLQDPVSFIDLSTLPTGPYVLRASSNEGSLCLRLVKE